MRKLTLTLLLACMGAHADTVGMVNNKGGGVIVLTDVSCKTESGYYVYSQLPNAPTQFGCWWSDDAMVHITWSDGEFRSYPLNAFTVNHRNADRMRARENRKTY